MHETAFVIGCAMAGWVIPEFMAAISNRPAPLALNWFGFVAGALISFGTLR